MEGSDFLDKKYPDLAGSKIVDRIAKKLKRQGKETPYGRSERAKAYVDRIAKFAEIERGDGRTGFDILKQKVLDRYVTKQDEIPESYWKLQEKIMRERGQGGDWANASEADKNELKRQNSEGVLGDQRASLEQWVDYLGTDDSSYIPNELKYWILRNVLGLQEYDKEKKEFPKRSKGTVKQFPDINYEALGYLVDAVKKKLGGTAMEFEHDIQPDERAEFLKFLEKEDFAKLYAWANELMNPIPEHLLPVTDGEWRKYDQGSDASNLVKTIRGKGTGWCTAGENTARAQLGSGDFYVFYSLDDDKKATIPRIAIRMEGDKIAEVRGVAYKQNLDPYMNDVLIAKLDEFPDKKDYIKKDADMKMLTDIENKIKKQEALGRSELIFLYEIDSKITGFGYQDDPRIKELRKNRDPKQDAPIVFECEPNQITWNKDEISTNTKVYVGPLFKGVFILHLEHIYASFPEMEVKKSDLEIGGQTKEQLKAQLLEKGFKISLYAEDMLDSPDFTTLANRENIKLARLKVKDLGFTSNPTTDELYAKAKEFGLELCPAEVGPHQRLKDKDQPLDQWYRIAMKQIADRSSRPRVFGVGRRGGGPWLYDGWANPAREWNLGSEIVFRLPS
ncbi:MAG: hypothetical protein KBD55_02660 [Candidatus Pacebacteria bacterium]|nr:hypothetical protein [Candidatus Paceibacterota bacterium]